MQPAEILLRRSVPPELAEWLARAVSGAVLQYRDDEHFDVSNAKELVSFAVLSLARLEESLSMGCDPGVAQFSQLGLYLLCRHWGRATK